MSARKDRNLDWDKIYKIVAIILLLVPANILLSFIYNFGYFNYFDVSLSQTPISWNDYVLTSVNWFTMVLVILVLYILTEYQFKRVEGYRTEEELTSSSLKLKKFRNSEHYILPIVVFSTFIGYLLFGKTFSHQKTFIFSMLYIYFYMWLSNHKNYSTKVSDLMKTLILGLPTLFIFFYFLGQDVAESNYRNPTITANITEREGNYNLIRVFEKFILLKNKENKIFIYSSENKYFLTSSSGHVLFNGYLSHFLDQNDHKREKK